jgi:hypothetical protein
METALDSAALPVLRPLRLGELLDQAIRLYRNNFLTFVGIIALVEVPFAVLQIIWSVFYTQNLTSALQGNPREYIFSSGYWLSIFSSFGVGFLRLILVGGLGTAVLTHAIARNYLGQKTSLLEAYQQMGSGWLRLLGTLVLFVVLAIALVIWAIVPCVGWLTGPGLLVFLSFAVAPLIPAAVVIEKSGGFAPISRAWDLGRRRFWWLLGFAAVLYIFSQVVVTAPTALVSYGVGLVAGNSGNLATQSVLSTVVGGVTGVFFNLLFLPLQLTAWTLVYFDLRVRTEGFDLALLAASTSAAPVDVASLPAAAPAQKLFAVEDMGKAIAVSLIFVGLYALLVGIIAVIALVFGALRGF